MKKRIMFYCQPVLGMGHLVRSLALLRGLTGFEIWFINGGRPLGEELRQLVPAEMTIIDLPPLEADPEFRDIRAIDPPGNLAADLAEVKAERQRLLLELLARIEPALLLIELYPFGRLKFDFELRPLLEAARGLERSPWIVSSLRDILVAKRDQAGFEKFAVTTANRFFDLILVHSDPQFQLLDETFPRVGELTCRIEYTGYVVPPADRPSRPTAAAGGLPTIVASIGGGRVGIELLRTTAAASRIVHAQFPHRLRLFTGPYLPESDRLALREMTAMMPWIEVAGFTPDLGGEMRTAALSISMAGYNTCMDILTTGIPAIVHPFTGNDNREQTLRARKLEAAGLVRLISDEELTPEKLARMIAAMLDQPPSAPHLKIDLEGVQRTAAILLEMTTPEILKGDSGEERQGERG
jgi:predicted glycosyltransferase